MEWELAPYSGKPPLHTHPNAIETYEILEGEMEVFFNDKWSTLKKGNKATVDKGISHTFKNSTNKTVRVYNTHQPAMKFDEYFEGLCKIVNTLSVNGKNN